MCERELCGLFPYLQCLLVYFYYDYQLIIANSLALTWYQQDAVDRVIRSRLDFIYEVVRDGSFDIYEKPVKFKMNPIICKSGKMSEIRLQVGDLIGVVRERSIFRLRGILM
jgi:hypothetical protein